MMIMQIHPQGDVNQLLPDSFLFFSFLFFFFFHYYHFIDSCLEACRLGASTPIIDVHPIFLC